MSRILERLERRRAFVAEHAGQQPGHGINHHGGGQLAAAQDVIPDRDLLVREVLGHPLVDALIPPANQQQFGLARETIGHRLLEQTALGRKQDD